MLRSRVKELVASALKSETGTIESVELLDDQHTDEGIASQHLDIVIKFKEQNIPEMKLFAKVGTAESGFDESISDEDYNMIFRMENLFYVCVAPSLHKLASAYGMKLPIPKCYGCVSENNCTLVVLEHLKDQGYNLFPEVETKSLQLDSNALSKVLKELGKLHGLSLLQSELLDVPVVELYPALQDWHYFINKSLAEGNMQECFKTKIPNYAEPKQAEILSKFIDISAQVFNEIKNASYKCVSLLHNDMWRNNILQRNKEIVILDFQLWCVGPVTLDIIQWLFFGGNVEEIKPERLRQNLEVYLESMKEPWLAAGKSLPDNWTVENLEADFEKCAPTVIIYIYFIMFVPNLSPKCYKRLTDNSMYIIEKFLDKKFSEQIFG